MKIHKKHSTNSRFVFHKSIRKHGWDHFEWQIIYQSWDLEHTRMMESTFIEQYNSLLPSGYNMTKGGEGCVGRKMTEVNRQRWIDKHKGIPLSETHKANLKKSRSDNPVRNVKQWIVTTPSKEQERIKNLSSYARLHNLNYMCLRDVAVGKQKQHRGYKVILSIG